MAHRAARKAHGRRHKANGGAYKANGGAYKANGGAYKANSGAHKAQNGTLGKPTHTARGTRKCGISFFTFRYRISTVFLRRVFCRFSRAKKYVRHISNYVRHILKYKAHIFYLLLWGCLFFTQKFSFPAAVCARSGERCSACAGVRADGAGRGTFGGVPVISFPKVCCLVPARVAVRAFCGIPAGC